MLRLSNPGRRRARVRPQAQRFIVDDDPFDPLLLDDFERGAYLWNGRAGLASTTPRSRPAIRTQCPGRTPIEHVLEVTAPVAVDIEVQAATGCNRGRGNGVIPVPCSPPTRFDATTVDHTTRALRRCR